MNKVKILTDSSVYLDPADAETLDIYTVPLTITIGNQTFKDGTAEARERFFEAQDQNLITPVITAPTPKEFERAYADLHKKTDKILSLHVSGKISPTCKNSISGAETLRGRCNIEIVDTHSILLGQGILVKAAAKAAEQGATIDQIVRLVRGLIPHIYIVMFVDSMIYLERSGTIGKAQSVLGSMMKIKPLLFIEDGEIIPMEKVKTTEKAIDKLTEFVSEFDTIEQTVIIQRATKHTTETNILLDRLSQIFPDKNFPVIPYNPLMASYVGSNAMGVIVYEGMTNF